MYPIVNHDPAPILEWLVDFILNLLPTLLDLLKKVIGTITGLALVLCVFLFIAIIYCVEQLKRIRKKEEEKYNLKVEPAFEEGVKNDDAMARRWDRAQTFVSSNNPNDWKQAVIEADILLDDLLTKMGYKGESVGEKLKRVARGDMKSLDDAWEAHKVRNQIAHTPDFVLDHHVAHHTIRMYKKVFEEFYYI